MKLKLISFNETKNISVSAEIVSQKNQFELNYLVHSNQPITWPTATNQSIKDELWKSTCLELFVADLNSPSYLEFNFSPQLSWNTYHLNDYRQGLTSVANHFDPKISASKAGATYQLNVQFQMPEKFQYDDFEFNLTAVIESGSHITYWAAKHPQNQPDFHNRSCFLKSPHQ